MLDISVFAVFHREGTYAIPALASMFELANKTRAQGLSVEAIALLDRSDEETTRLVAHNGEWLDDILHVDFGDLGLTRNAGVERARGRYLAFLDGDDLWGSDWLWAAHAAAVRASLSGEEAIWHPEVLFYFYEEDFDRHSVTKTPHPSALSHYFRHVESTSPDFEPTALWLNNVWSANVFAHRSIYEANPYKAVDKESGYGIEDWSWNIQTYCDGIPHRIVSDTVHLIRVKLTGSLGQSNAAAGLLPHLPPDFTPWR